MHRLFVKRGKKKEKKKVMKSGEKHQYDLIEL